MSVTPERGGQFSFLTTPSPWYICLTWKEDANAAWSTGVRLMFCGDKIMVNYSLELILWWVRDGNTSWCWCLTALEGHVNASQLLGDPEHRANGHPVCAGMFLSQATLSFTVGDDIKWAVCQNSGGPVLIYCLRQSDRSVIRHPLRGIIEREQCHMVPVTKMLQESSEWFTANSLQILSRERQLVCSLIWAPGRVQEWLMDRSIVPKWGCQDPWRCA